MYPDAFRTELSNSLTALYEHPEESRCWRLSRGQALDCKFEAKTAHAPDGADGICAAEEGRRRRPRPPRRKLQRLPARALRRRRSPKAKGAIQSFQPGSIVAGNPVGKQNLVQQKDQNRAVRICM